MKVVANAQQIHLLLFGISSPPLNPWIQNLWMWRAECIFLRDISL